MSFLLKFDISTPYEKFQKLHVALEEFVKSRPREWVALIAFRSTRVEADLGFVEYIVFAQHRGTCSFVCWPDRICSLGFELTSIPDLRDRILGKRRGP